MATAITRYSELTLQKLRATAVMYGLFNHSYEGVPTAGAVKVPVRDTEATFNRGYNKLTGAAFTNAEGSFATITIDEDLYVNELIDGYDADSAPDNLVGDRIDSAGYSNGIMIDTELIHKCAVLGTGSVNTSKTDAYGIMVAYVKAAKKAHIRPSEMWFVVSPDWMETMLNDNKFVQATQKGDAVVEDGAVKKVAGVDVYESDNMPDTIDFILGNRVFCHMVDEWKIPVSVNNLADGHIGASAVQGREVYGAGISRTETVFCKKSDSYTTPSGVPVTNKVTMPS